MKKTFFFVLATLLMAHQASAAEHAVINNVVGEPMIVRGDKTIPAINGMPCQTGDVLKTPTAGCQFDVAVNGLAGCRVLSNSECVIINGAKSNMKIQIKNGNAILNLKKLPENSSFQVETPTAIAAVRGTQFWGRVDASNLNNPVTTFAVREGFVNVFVKSAGKTFSLRKGQALDIPKDTSAVPLIRPALEDEMKTMEQAASIQTSA